MIQYETIISNFDDKTTLYNWLRKVEEALKHASATNFVVNKKGNATLSFSITFADGTTLESGDIVLQQGESVDDARIASGILQLHLTNGTWLTAGNLGAVSSFSIDANQHLIVNYQDGTSQDLGAIFTGSVTLTGDLSVGQNLYAKNMLNPNSDITLEADNVGVTGKLYVATGAEIDNAVKLNSSLEVAGTAELNNDVEINAKLSVTGDLEVAGKINNEPNPSVKPIYYHPIINYTNNSQNYSEAFVSFMILDNDGYGYTGDTFRAKAKALMDLGASLTMQGYIKGNDNNGYIPFIAGKNNNQYQVTAYSTANPLSIAYFNFDKFIDNNLVDGVNKIN